LHYIVEKDDIQVEVSEEKLVEPDIERNGMVVLNVFLK
jgi:hypothetical protein